MLLTQSQTVLMCVILLFGTTIPLQFTIGFIYLLELMPEDKQATVSTVQNIAATFTVVLCALYFAFVSKRWIYYALLGYAMQIAQLVSLRYLPESPR